jgi:hypothetical protein
LPVACVDDQVAPFERMLSLDERLEGAAARPVIVPETIVEKNGRVDE